MTHHSPMRTNPSSSRIRKKRDAKLLSKEMEPLHSSDFGIMDTFASSSDEVFPSVKPLGASGHYYSNMMHLGNRSHSHLTLSKPSMARQEFLTRSLWGIVMSIAFTLIILAGHRYVIILVYLVQTMIFKEVIAIAHVPSQQKRLPWFRALTWYFLFTTNYFLYGESFCHYFKKSFLVDAFLLPFATHHRFISFSLYMLGIVLFVINLKKGYYRFQFGQFAWTHMTLILVVFQSHFIINNIFEGLIWFVLPVSMVIANDIAAYIFGKLFGKTPLIRLSPKKTWEGFIGALLCTLVFSFFFSRFLAQFSYIVCPVEDWSASALVSSQRITCQPHSVFNFKSYTLPPFLSALLTRIFRQPVKELSVAPIQWHALIMAIFSSLIAPFGGFFASGFKRAFKIKDFSDSIPGHGGITDRMDCVIVMSLFAYMYVSSFIKETRTTVSALLQIAITGLLPEDQLELYQALRSYLVAQGLLQE